VKQIYEYYCYNNTYDVKFSTSLYQDCKNPGRQVNMATNLLCYDEYAAHKWRLHTHKQHLRVKHVMLQMNAMTTVCHLTPPLKAHTMTRCDLPFNVNSQKYRTRFSSSITQNNGNICCRPGNRSWWHTFQCPFLPAYNL